MRQALSSQHGLVWGGTAATKLMVTLKGSDCPYGQATASLLAASIQYAKGDYGASLTHVQAGLEYLLMKPG